MRNLSVNGERLWSTIMETARFGGTPDGGVRRLALSEEDGQARAWFVAACRDAGCAVRIDQMGSIFALRPGSDPEALPVAMGSHLDTQPTGGKFDGILGVLAGLEVLRVLNDNGITTRHPLALVNWTNEEGSRFAPATMASAIHAGEQALDATLATRDAAGISVGDALRAIGYNGDMVPGTQGFDSMFELHIEQGPLLEAAGNTIGIVTGVQGMRWYRLRVDGQASHAGTTPMALRRDALAATAEVMLAVRDAAIAHGAVATFGTIAIENESHNVVPGVVHTTLDLRAPDDSRLNAVEAVMEAMAADARLAGTVLHTQCIWRNAPVSFDPDCVDLVAEAARAADYPAARIVSGAGHDAACIAAVAPTAMIFVPCRDGLSHNPAESATPDHCAAGAQVLLNTVLSRAGVVSE